MEVSHGEGLANRTGPELWRFSREGLLQALAGESAGRVCSREIDVNGSADDFVMYGRQHATHRSGEMGGGSPRSETPARMETLCAKIGRSRRWPDPVGPVRAANPKGARLR